MARVTHLHGDGGSYEMATLPYDPWGRPRFAQFNPLGEKMVFHKYQGNRPDKSAMFDNGNRFLVDFDYQGKREGTYDQHKVWAQPVNEPAHTRWIRAYDPFGAVQTEAAGPWRSNFDYPDDSSLILSGRINFKGLTITDPVTGVTRPYDLTRFKYKGRMNALELFTRINLPTQERTKLALLGVGGELAAAVETEIGNLGMSRYNADHPRDIIKALISAGLVTQLHLEEFVGLSDVQLDAKVTTAVARVNAIIRVVGETDWLKEIDPANMTKTELKVVLSELIPAAIIMNITREQIDPDNSTVTDPVTIYKFSVTGSPQGQTMIAEVRIPGNDEESSGRIVGHDFRYRKMLAGVVLDKNNDVVYTSKIDGYEIIYDDVTKQKRKYQRIKVIMRNGKHKFIYIDPTDKLGLKRYEKSADGKWFTQYVYTQIEANSPYSYPSLTANYLYFNPNPPRSGEINSKLDYGKLRRTGMVGELYKGSAYLALPVHVAQVTAAKFIDYLPLDIANTMKDWGIIRSTVLVPAIVTNSWDGVSSVVYRIKGDPTERVYFKITPTGELVVNTKFSGFDAIASITLEPERDQTTGDFIPNTLYTPILYSRATRRKRGDLVEVENYGGKPGVTTEVPFYTYYNEDDPLALKRLEISGVARRFMKTFSYDDTNGTGKIRTVKLQEDKITTKEDLSLVIREDNLNNYYTNLTGISQSIAFQQQRKAQRLINKLRAQMINKLGQIRVKELGIRFKIQTIPGSTRKELIVVDRAGSVQKRYRLPARTTHHARIISRLERRFINDTGRSVLSLMGAKFYAVTNELNGWMHAIARDKFGRSIGHYLPLDTVYQGFKPGTTMHHRGKVTVSYYPNAGKVTARSYVYDLVDVKDSRGRTIDRGEKLNSKSQTVWAKTGVRHNDYLKEPEEPNRHRGTADREKHAKYFITRNITYYGWEQGPQGKEWFTAQEAMNRWSGEMVTSPSETKDAYGNKSYDTMVYSLPEMPEHMLRTNVTTTGWTKVSLSDSNVSGYDFIYLYTDIEDDDTDLELKITSGGKTITVKTNVADNEADTVPFWFPFSSNRMRIYGSAGRFKLPKTILKRVSSVMAPEVPKAKYPLSKRVRVIAVPQLAAQGLDTANIDVEARVAGSSSRGAAVVKVSAIGRLGDGRAPQKDVKVITAQDNLAAFDKGVTERVSGQDDLQRSVFRRGSHGEEVYLGPNGSYVEVRLKGGVPLFATTYYQEAGGKIYPVNRWFAPESDPNNPVPLHTFAYVDGRLLDINYALKQNEIGIYSVPDVTSLTKVELFDPSLREQGRPRILALGPGYWAVFPLYSNPATGGFERWANSLYSGLHSAMPDFLYRRDGYHDPKFDRVFRANSPRVNAKQAAAKTQESSCLSSYYLTRVPPDDTHPFKQPTVLTSTRAQQPLISQRDFVLNLINPSSGWRDFNSRTNKGSGLIYTAPNSVAESYIDTVAEAELVPILLAQAAESRQEERDLRRQGRTRAADLKEQEAETIIQAARKIIDFYRRTSRYSPSGGMEFIVDSYTVKGSPQKYSGIDGTAIWSEKTAEAQIAVTRAAFALAEHTGDERIWKFAIELLNQTMKFMPDVNKGGFTKNKYEKPSDVAPLHKRPDSYPTTANVKGYLLLRHVDKLFAELRSQGVKIDRGFGTRVSTAAASQERWLLDNIGRRFQADQVVIPGMKEYLDPRAERKADQTALGEELSSNTEEWLWFLEAARVISEDTLVPANRRLAARVIKPGFLETSLTKLAWVHGVERDGHWGLDWTFGLRRLHGEAISPEMTARAWRMAKLLRNHPATEVYRTTLNRAVHGTDVSVAVGVPLNGTNDIPVVNEQEGIQTGVGTNVYPQHPSRGRTTPTKWSNSLSAAAAVVSAGSDIAVYDHNVPAGVSVLARKIKVIQSGAARPTAVTPGTILPTSPAVTASQQEVKPVAKEAYLDEKVKEFSEKGHISKIIAAIIVIWGLMLFIMTLGKLGRKPGHGPQGRTPGASGSGSSPSGRGAARSGSGSSSTSASGTGTTQTGASGTNKESVFKNPWVRYVPVIILTILTILLLSGCMDTVTNVANSFFGYYETEGDARLLHATLVVAFPITLAIWSRIWQAIYTFWQNRIQEVTASSDPGAGERQELMSAVTRQDAARRWSEIVLGTYQPNTPHRLMLLSDGAPETDFLVSLRLIHGMVLEWRKDAAGIVSGSPANDAWLKGTEAFAVMTGVMMRKIVFDGFTDKRGQYIDGNHIWHRLETMFLEYREIMRGYMEEYKTGDRAVAEAKIIALLSEMGVEQRTDPDVDINDMDLYIVNTSAKGEPGLRQVRRELEARLGIHHSTIVTFEDNFTKFMDQEEIEGTSPYAIEVASMLPRILAVLVGVVVWHAAKGNTVRSFAEFFGRFFDLDKYSYHVVDTVKHKILATLDISYFAELGFYIAGILLALGILFWLLGRARKSQRWRGKTFAGNVQVANDYKIWQRLSQFLRAAALFIILVALHYSCISGDLTAVANFDQIILRSIVQGLLLLEALSLVFFKKSMIWLTIRYHLRPPAHWGGWRAFFTSTLLWLVFIGGSIFIGYNVYEWFDKLYSPTMSFDNTFRLLAGVMIFINNLYMLNYGIWVLFTGLAGAFTRFPKGMTLGSVAATLMTYALYQNIWACALPAAIGFFALVLYIKSLVAAREARQDKRELDNRIYTEDTNSKKTGFIFFGGQNTGSQVFAHWGSQRKAYERVTAIKVASHQWVTDRWRYLNNNQAGLLDSIRDGLNLNALVDSFDYRVEVDSWMGAWPDLLRNTITKLNEDPLFTPDPDWEARLNQLAADIAAHPSGDYTQVPQWIAELESIRGAIGACKRNEERADRYSDYAWLLGRAMGMINGIVNDMQLTRQFSSGSVSQDTREEIYLVHVMNQIHEAELNSGVGLYHLDQLDDPNLLSGGSTNLGVQIGSLNRDAVVLAWRIRRRLVEIMPPGTSQDSGINLVEMADTLGQTDLGQKMTIYLASNKWGGQDPDRSGDPSPSNMLHTDKGPQADMLQREKQAALIEYFLNGRQPRSVYSSTPVEQRGTSYVVHNWTPFGFKSAGMTSLDMTPDEMMNMHSLVISDRNATITNLDAFTQDVRRMRENDDVVMLLTSRGTTNTMMPVGQASQLVEEGHSTMYHKAVIDLLGGERSESLGTGWGNILSVSYPEFWEAMSNPAQKSVPLTSRLQHQQGFFPSIMPKLFGHIGFGPHAVGISEDIWAVQQESYEKIALGKIPRYLSGRARWRKSRESFTHAVWLAAYPRWGGGSLQKRNDWMMQNIHDFGPISIFNKDVRSGGGRFFDSAPFAFLNIALTPILIAWGLTPFIGIKIIFWLMGTLFNQVLTIHGLMLYLKSSGFNRITGAIGVAAVLLASIFKASWLLLFVPASIVAGTAPYLIWILALAIFAYLIGGHIVGLGRWVATRGRDMMLFAAQLMIHVMGQMVRQTLEFKLSAPDDPNPDAVNMRKAFWPLGGAGAKFNLKNTINTALEQNSLITAGSVAKTLIILVLINLGLAVTGHFGTTSILISLGYFVFTLVSQKFYRFMLSMQGVILTGLFLTISNFIVMQSLDLANVIMLFPSLMFGIGLLAGPFVMNLKIGTARTWFAKYAGKPLGWFLAAVVLFAFNYIITGMPTSWAIWGLLGGILLPLLIFVIGKTTGQGEFRRFSSEQGRAFVLGLLVLVWPLLRVPTVQTMNMKVMGYDFYLMFQQLVDSMWYIVPVIIAIIFIGWAIGRLTKMYRLKQQKDFMARYDTAVARGLVSSTDRQNIEVLLNEFDFLIHQESFGYAKDFLWEAREILDGRVYRGMERLGRSPYPAKINDAGQEIIGGLAELNRDRHRVTVKNVAGAGRVAGIGDWKEDLLLTGDNVARLEEALEYAAGEQLAPGQERKVKLLISGSIDNLIQFAKKNQFEIHRAFLRGPPAGAQETEAERQLFLNGAVWHDMHHLLHPKDPEEKVEAATIEHFVTEYHEAKAEGRVSILEATIKVLRDDNRNWIYGAEWLSSLETALLILRLQEAVAAGEVTKIQLPYFPVEGEINKESLDNMLGDLLLAAQYSKADAKGIMAMLLKGDPEKMAEYIEDLPTANELLKNVNRLAYVLTREELLNGLEMISLGELARTSILPDTDDRGISLTIIDAEMLLGMNPERVKLLLQILQRKENKRLMMVKFRSNREIRNIEAIAKGLGISSVYSPSRALRNPEDKVVKLAQTNFGEIAEVAVITCSDNFKEWNPIQHFNYRYLSSFGPEVAISSFLRLEEDLPRDMVTTYPWLLEPRQLPFVVINDPDPSEESGFNRQLRTIDNSV